MRHSSNSGLTEKQIDELVGVARHCCETAARLRDGRIDGWLDRATEKRLQFELAEAHAHLDWLKRARHPERKNVVPLFQRPRLAKAINASGY